MTVSRWRWTDTTPLSIYDAGEHGFKGKQAGFLAQNAAARSLNAATATSRRRRRARSRFSRISPGAATAVGPRRAKKRSGRRA